MAAHDLDQSNSDKTKAVISWNLKKTLKYETMPAALYKQHFYLAHVGL